MRETDYEVMEVIVHAVTHKAILVSESGEEDDADWIPISQIKDAEMEYERGEGYVIEIPSWLADEKDIR